MSTDQSARLHPQRCHDCGEMITSVTQWWNERCPEKNPPAEGEDRGHEVDDWPMLPGNTVRNIEEAK